VAGTVVVAERGATVLAICCGLIALLPLAALATAVGLPVLLLAVAAAGVWVWHRWTRSSSTVNRWGSRTRRKSEVASTLDVVRHAGSGAMRRRAGAVRPSLAGMDRRERWRLPVPEVAVLLCRSGLVMFDPCPAAVIR